MNFLAHFLLAQPTSASRAGNFLGDFITGTPESLKPSIPQDILDGIIMHRRIDVFTDSHPSFKASKTYLKPERKRFAGIILDIFTDHFLAKNWISYSDTPLKDYNEEVYSQLKSQWAYFPEDAKKAATWMYEGEWFLKYAEVDGIDLVLQGMSKRRPKFDPIAGGIEDLIEHYDTFQSSSKTLLNEAIKHNFSD